MFFRYNTEPARLLRLFRAFRCQALRLRRFRGVYLAVWSVALAVYGIVTLPLLQADDGFAPYFLFFGAAGSVSLLLAWGWIALFTAYPRKRRGHGFKAGGVVGLFFATFGGFIMLAGWWDGLSPDPLALLSQPAGRAGLLWPWAWSGLGLFLLSRGIVWLRLKSVFVENDELDYLYRTLKPLLRDLPPDAVCSLGCNPFHAMWTLSYREAEARGRNLRTYDDVLLDFKAKLAGGSVFVLRTLHRRIDKYKIRKSKYKGSKHRIAQVYRMEQPGLGSLKPADYKRFVELQSRWQAQADGFESTLRQQVRDGALALTVAQKKKFRGDRELTATDLPDTTLTLKTVQALSAFATAQKEPDRPAG